MRPACRWFRCVTGRGLPAHRAWTPPEATESVSSREMHALLNRICSRPAATRSSFPARAISMEANARSLTLAVVGDVHGQWDPLADHACLQHLQPDITVFVGDFGNEDVNIMQRVAELPLPKAVICGNHDCWRTGRNVNKMPSTARQRAATAAMDSNQPPASFEELAQSLPGGKDNAVLQQLQLLGDAHVGYSAMQVPGKSIAVAGSRPFSHGGNNFSTVKRFISTLYPGITGFKESARRVVEVVHKSASAGQDVVIVSHNAPAGLGDQAHDLAGVDWKPGAGDHGDPDLRLALDQLAQAGVHVPLVLCGHMHHKLHGGGFRRMVHVDGDTGTVTLNAAVVPRMRRVQPTTADPSQPLAFGTLHHFLRVQLEQGQVVQVSNVWVRAEQAQGPEGGFQCTTELSQEVLRRVQGEQGSTVHYYDASRDAWEQAYVHQAPATVTVNA